MNSLHKELSYFPGCSLATTAKENSASLKSFLERFDIKTKEVEDWNCCGSSSAYSINKDLSMSLATRNLFLAPKDKPMLIACPGCYLKLSMAEMELKTCSDKREKYEKFFGKSYENGTRLIHFFELLSDMDEIGMLKGFKDKLKGLKIVPYYGCMLARPPKMNKAKNYHGLIEKTMTALGGEVLRWAFASTCCGTYLSVTKPEIAGRLVNRIMEGAIQAGAECIVTACSMCHLNLEMRCSPEKQLPIFHFSELLSLAFDSKISKNWFKRHLIDPEPLMIKRKLFPCQQQPGA